MLHEGMVPIRREAPPIHIALDQSVMGLLLPTLPLAGVSGSRHGPRSPSSGGEVFRVGGLTCLLPLLLPLCGLLHSSGLELLPCPSVVSCTLSDPNRPQRFWHTIQQSIHFRAAKIAAEPPSHPEVRDSGTYCPYSFCDTPWNSPSFSPCCKVCRCAT